MKRKTIWVIAAILLLLVNVCFIGYLFQRQKEAERPRHGMETFFFLVKELDMSPQQTKQYARLRDRHRHHADRILRQGRDIKHRLFSNLTKTGAGVSVVNSLTAESGRNTATLDSLTFYHFREVRMILDDKQQQRFDEVIGDVLQMMAAPPPGQVRPPHQGAPPSRQGPPQGRRPFGLLGQQ
jgi:protein CpxP